MKEESEKFSIAVFPFLKTRKAVSVGKYRFRSTDDTDGLSPEQVECLCEIVDMLYLKDNLRIKTATYAVIPYVDLNYSGALPQHLIDIHTFVAYLYSSPHPTFGEPFLSSEHASMVILSPGPVSIFLLRPGYNGENAEEISEELKPDSRNEVKGYTGLYNFRHYFEVAKGSRIYGPMPHMTLNIAQNLSDDLDRASNVGADYRVMQKLLWKPKTSVSSRIFTALRWFNAANASKNDDSSAIVNLAIAFESLLRLPSSAKTDRFIDAISLLLGRLPRLCIWAEQFYNCRSQIVHEGEAEQLRFIATDSKVKTEDPLYGSLLLYGRQIFQLCLGTLLVGADLAEKAGLEEKFVTNHERFTRICTILSDEKINSCERLISISSIVVSIEQHRFIGESNLKIETMVGATRLASSTLIECEHELPTNLKVSLENVANSQRTDNHIQELNAIKDLESSFKNESSVVEIPCAQTVRKLVEQVWQYVFMHYYWLKESRKVK